jgi:hypothetical protein
MNPVTLGLSSRGKTRNATCLATGHGFRRAAKAAKSVRALAVLLLGLSAAAAQEMPRTPGDTLSGKHIILADQARGRPAILVAGFSREGGNGTGAWVKAIQSDSALSGIPVYEIAQIAGAPGFIRGLIRSGMKKSVPAAEHDTFVVLAQDESPWRSYFSVGDDKVPYVLVLDAAGKVLWRGHGSPAGQEPELKNAVKPVSP